MEFTVRKINHQWRSKYRYGGNTVNYLSIRNGISASEDSTSTGGTRADGTESETPSTEQVDLTNYYTKTETDTKLNNYLPKSGGTMTGHLLLGGGTDTAFKKVETIRNVNNVPNGAAFYTNSDGTAAFFHKTYSSTALAGAVNDAILRFDHNGLFFAKGATSRTSATDFKEVMTEEKVYTKEEVNNLLASFQNQINALSQRIAELGG